MLSNIITSILIILYIGLAVSIYVLVKNTNTYKQHIKISKAIKEYLCNHADEIENEDITSMFDSIQDYDKTLYRFWDWGYERIVPKDVLEKIQPYIGKWPPTPIETVKFKRNIINSILHSFRKIINSLSKKGSGGYWN